MSMIIPLKASPRYDLREPLSRWLDGPEEGELANPMEYVSVKPNFKSHQVRKELVRLTSLRNCICDAITKPQAHKNAIDEFGLQDCHEYHAALSAFINAGFPNRDEVSNLQLQWKGAVSPTAETHGSLEWDRACTLWNIAALCSFLAHQERLAANNDREKLKGVVKHYQMAAACMKYLQVAIVDQNFDVVDLSKPSLQFWENAMLAHAQMSAYEMAALGGSGHTLLASLALGAVPSFNEALQFSRDPLLLSSLPKPMQTWGTECKSLSLLLQGQGEYHQSLAHRDAKEFGQELARLGLAIDRLQECLDFLKQAKSLHDNVNKKAERLHAIVKDRKLRADHANRVYGEEVPPSPPAIPPRLLVKSDIPMPDSMAIPKVPLFDKM